MKNEDQVQQAHDLLVGIMLKEFPNPFEPKDQPSLVAATDVLCWVLDHTHNEQFARNLRQIEGFLAASGIVLVDHGPPAAPRRTQ